MRFTECFVGVCVCVCGIVHYRIVAFDMSSVCVFMLVLW